MGVLGVLGVLGMLRNSPKISSIPIIPNLSSLTCLWQLLVAPALFFVSSLRGGLARRGNLNRSVKQSPYCWCRSPRNLTVARDDASVNFEFLSHKKSQLVTRSHSSHAL